MPKEKVFGTGLQGVTAAFTDAIVETNRMISEEYKNLEHTDSKIGLILSNQALIMFFLQQQEFERRRLLNERSDGGSVTKRRPQTRDGQRGKGR